MSVLFAFGLKCGILGFNLSHRGSVLLSADGRTSAFLSFSLPSCQLNSIYKREEAQFVPVPKAEVKSTYFGYISCKQLGMNPCVFMKELRFLLCPLKNIRNLHVGVSTVYTFYSANNGTAILQLATRGQLCS